MISHALRLASLGFHVFPLTANTKNRPYISDYPNRAINAANQLQDWWQNGAHNVAISTSSFGSLGRGLLVIDVDNKNGKCGDASLLALELDGKELPETYTQFTPTGGRHLVYWAPEAVKQGVNILGDGLDIRSKGGYIVGSGSTIDGKPYTDNGLPVVPAPQWLIDACGEARPRGRPKREGAESVDQDRARKQAIVYLKKAAPSIEGQGGDHTAFVVAAKVRDKGVTEEDALTLMSEHWNSRCQPPWSEEELAIKVHNAYAYGENDAGCDAIESVFDPIQTGVESESDAAQKEGKLHPIDELNKNYAFVLVGGNHRVLFETVDAHGRFRVEHLSESAFHAHLAARSMSVGDKVHPISKLWLASPRRRSYNGICFLPGRDAPQGYYNLWRGFSVAPYATAAEASASDDLAVQMFLDHARENVCRKDETLFQWLMSFFAHTIQRPQVKPLTSLVFRGGKGVGKNALVDRVGHLLGSHYFVADSSRYLTSNFNSHMEVSLLVCFDEAFWSGDKSAEGQLKGLITGRNHVIERKGLEPYAVDNYTRVVIIGNEDWLVPASHDERRFAVFDVGDGRKQDRKFFREMREGMEAGAYRLLLRLLLDWSPLADIDGAPETEALADQKRSSLDLFHQWWLDCLGEGVIAGGDFNSWPEYTPTARLRSAYERYCRAINTRARLESGRKFKEQMRAVAGAHCVCRKEGGEEQWCYRLPPLGVARRLWEQHIGHKENWNATENETRN